MASEPRGRAAGDLACPSAQDWVHSSDAQTGKSDVRASAYGAARRKAGPKTAVGEPIHWWSRHVNGLLSPTLSSRGGEGGSVRHFCLSIKANSSPPWPSPRAWL